MKWKRSKKAQQEAKEKKSSTSSTSSSAVLPPTVSADVSMHKSDTTHHIESGSNGLQKNLTNLDQHRHNVNLMPNINDYSNLEDNVNNNGIMRRPLFIPDGQNGDMFRPYVV